MIQIQTMTCPILLFLIKKKPALQRVRGCVYAIWQRKERETLAVSDMDWATLAICYIVYLIVAKLINRL